MARAFRILRTLGSGAFGEVHLTEVRDDEDFVQTLAVKSLHSQYSDDPEVGGRLRDEARLMALLQHPNIVRVQGLTRIEGRLAILMEAVPGVDLTDRHLPPKAAAEMVAAVADALEAAWNTVPPGRSDPLRVVHRDIKPSNIMVTPRGEVKVMDFGVARATFETREAKTRSQQYGTARYMAPERWLEGIAGAPSDVFSLGITLIEVASGQPFPRPRLSKGGFAEDIATPLQTLDAWPDLQALATEMIAFDPNLRPKASEVRERCLALHVPGHTLRDWAATLRPSAGTTDALTGTVVLEETDADTFALAVTATAPLAEAPVGPPVPKWVPWSALGVGLVLAMGAGFLFSNPESPVPPLPVPASSEPLAPLPKPTVAPPPLPEPTTPERPPEPAPPPETLPVPRPEAMPAPSPTKAAPEPEPAVEEPKPAQDQPTVQVIFDTDPGLTVQTSHGSLRPGRGVLKLPQNKIAVLRVKGDGESFNCTINVGTASAAYRIRASGSCTKEG